MAYDTNPKLPEIRARAVRLIHDGWSTRKVARYLGYAQGTIVKWRKRASSSFPRIIRVPHRRLLCIPRAFKSHKFLVLFPLFLKPVRNRHKGDSFPSVNFCFTYIKICLICSLDTTMHGFTPIQSQVLRYSS